MKSSLCDSFRLGLLVAALPLVLACQSVWSEGEQPHQVSRDNHGVDIHSMTPEQRAAYLKKEMQDAQHRNADTAGMTADQKDAYRKKEADRREKDAQQQALADRKELLMNSLASVKDMDAKAEAAFKEKQYRVCAGFYQSIALATVAGSEAQVEKARNRLVELEDLSKAKLKEADEAEYKQDFMAEIDLLATIGREFPQTKTAETAMRKLAALKSRADVAGYVELAQAEVLEKDGKLVDAIALYKSISANPRYENTLPGLKAVRKLDELNKNEEVKTKVKGELEARADKEAPLLLAAAKNFAANSRPKLAIEKLQTVIEKFPESKYAEQAKQQIEELKDIK
jgi:hypothetical protein